MILIHLRLWSSGQKLSVHNQEVLGSIPSMDKLLITKKKHGLGPNKGRILAKSYLIFYSVNMKSDRALEAG